LKFGRPYGRLYYFPSCLHSPFCLALDSRPYKEGVAVVFSLSLLGIVTGQITGFSRESAVGTVLPAVLGLLGGVMVYLVGTKGKRLQLPVVMSVIGLTLNLLVGTYWGAYLRGSPGALAYQALAKENARYTAELQKLLNDQKYNQLKAAFEAQRSE